MSEYPCYDCGAKLDKQFAFMRVSDGFYFCDLCIAARVVNEIHYQGDEA